MTQAQFDELVKVTVDKVKTTQIDYARDNKSPMMQKEGLRAALVFQNYAMQQFYTITHNFLQMFRAETPQGRAEAIRFIGAWGATTIAVAGVAGIIKIEPLYLMLVGLMMAFGSDDEDPEAMLRSSMADWNKDLRNVLLKGAPYAAGVDVSRAGYSPVIPVDEMWKLYQDPHSGQKDWYSLIGKTLGGAPTDLLFKNVIGAASKAFVDGEPMKALEMLTPKAFGLNDAVRAFNYANSGVTTAYGNTVVPKEEITTKDKVIRFLGFTPSSVAEAQAKRHAGSFSSSVVKADKYELLDSYAKAALAGKDMTAIVQQIIQFNKKNPADALTKASLIGSVKRRAKGEAMYNTFGVQVRSKGDILRARETAPEYDTGDDGLTGAQQLKDNPDLTGTDPSMLGIAANIETMKNLHLRLGQSRQAVRQHHGPAGRDQGHLEHQDHGRGGGPAAAARHQRGRCRVQHQRGAATDQDRAGRGADHEGHPARRAGRWPWAGTTTTGCPWGRNVRPWSWARRSWPGAEMPSRCRRTGRSTTREPLRDEADQQSQGSVGQHRRGRQPEERCRRIAEPCYEQDFDPFFCRCSGRPYRCERLGHPDQGRYRGRTKGQVRRPVSEEVGSQVEEEVDDYPTGARGGRAP